MTLLYRLATPTTEQGRIELPDIPKGATVSIPELEDVGVEWYVDGLSDALGYVDKAVESGVSSLPVPAANLEGIVPAANLPSYVDDVVEGYMYASKFYSDSQHTQQVTPEQGKIYVDLQSQNSYRWGGSSWAVVSTLSTATTSSNGLMSSTDKAKLDAFGNAEDYALKSDITNVYRYKGSVATVAALPASGNTVGDVYDVQERGINYAWDGTKWDPLGELFALESISNEEIDSLFV